MEIVYFLLILIVVTLWIANRRAGSQSGPPKTVVPMQIKAGDNLEAKDEQSECVDAIISRLTQYVGSRKGDTASNESTADIVARLRDQYVTGVTTSTSDGGWILNPQSTLPLTIYELDQAGVEGLKRILDKGGPDPYDLAPSLVRFMARNNFCCKEIDDYINEFKPKYLAKIEELKRSCPQWASLSKQDRDDLLVEFRQQAIDSLRVRPDCHLSILFELEPEDLGLSDIPIEQFSFENVSGFLDYADNNNEVLSHKTHTRQIASVIVYTYLLVCTYQRGNREAGEKEEILGTGWEILCESDACAYCKRYAGRKYSKTKIPKVPLHIGCRCEAGEAFE